MPTVMALYKYREPPIGVTSKASQYTVVILNEFWSAAWCKWAAIKLVAASATPSNNEKTRELGTATNLLMHSQTSLHFKKQNPKLRNTPLVNPYFP